MTTTETTTTMPQGTSRHRRRARVQADTLPTKPAETAQEPQEPQTALDMGAATEDPPTEAPAATAGVSEPTPEPTPEPEAEKKPKTKPRRRSTKAKTPKTPELVDPSDEDLANLGRIAWQAKRTGRTIEDVINDSRKLVAIADACGF